MSDIEIAEKHKIPFIMILINLCLNTIYKVFFYYICIFSKWSFVCLSFLFLFL